MKLIGLAASALVASLGVASAATLQNGGFDMAPSADGMRGNSFADLSTAAKRKNSWDVWQDLPGWTTTSGAGIEVQSSQTLGFAAHSGDHYVELDSYGNASMAQTIALTAGVYDLTFAYAGRTSDALTNSIGYSIAGMAGSVTDVRGNGWTEIVQRFTVLQDGDYVLSFAATGTSDSYGGLLDTVGISEVPLPASALLLLGGLAGLGAFGRRKS